MDDKCDYMRRWLLILAFFSLGLTGCSSRQLVHVVDANGAPIQGAAVEAVSPSINSTPNLTDASGDAPLPSNIQGSTWVQISKIGYDSIQVDMPSKWPLQVTLTKSRKSKP
jgi:hypothetical protein